MNAVYIARDSLLEVGNFDCGHVEVCFAVCYAAYVSFPFNAIF